MEAEAYLLSGFGIRMAMEARKGWECFSVFGDVSQPPRTKGTLVSPEYGTPYLAATQIFDVRPVPRKWLALQRIQHAETLFTQPSTILVTRSGLVGRATLAYTPHVGVLLSDDLLRVRAKQEDYWGWLYTYLRTPTARAMMTSVQYGHIIKHLEVKHLNALPLPNLPKPLLGHFNERAKGILAAREKGHAAMVAAQQRFEECIGPVDTATTAEVGFAVRSSALFGHQRRIDAWPHSPLVEVVKKHLAKGHQVMPLHACGYDVWVPGRYKRIPAEDGVIYLDSADIFEVNPDLSKQFAECGFGDEYGGRVQKGWLLMASSGQVYGIIGDVVLGNPFFEGKAISNHVMRIAPTRQPLVRPGYLVTALSHPFFGRPVVKSFAFGSSVPEIAPENVRQFGIVRLSPADEDYIADQAEQAADWRAEADLLENELAAEAEEILSQFIAGDRLNLSHQR